jgi:hypothetical protein
VTCWGRIGGEVGGRRRVDEKGQKEREQWILAQKEEEWKGESSDEKMVMVKLVV